MSFRIVSVRRALAALAISAAAPAWQVTEIEALSPARRHP